MRKRFMSLALVLSLVSSCLVFGACTSTENGKESSGKTAEANQANISEAHTAGNGKAYRIGVSFDYLSDFMATCVDGVEAFAADNPNVEVTIQDAGFDVAKQLQHVENFVSSGYDAVLIKPVDAEGCGPISLACKEADIPFVVINSNITDPCNVYVGSDNVLGGEMQAQFVADTLKGKANIAILQGDLMNEATTNRTQGIENIVAKNPDMKIVSMQEAGWMRDEAMRKMENWLSAGLEIDAVIANNDEMALGAALVLQEAGIEDVLVIGIDATQDALKAMQDGILDMTVFQDGFQQAYQGCEAALKLIQGENVPEYIDIAFVPVLPADVDTYLAK